MTRASLLKTVLLALGCLGLAALFAGGIGRGEPRSSSLPGSTEPTAESAPQFTAAGRMVLPAAYRSWRFVTSGLGMTYGPAGSADGRGHPRFDNVFANPSAYEGFLRDGCWPDHTVLVLEVRNSESQVSINRGGHFQTPGVVAIEAHVKDTARFAGGWGFFDFDDGATRATMLPTRMSCYSCHSQHGAVDTTFVQFYPTLLEVARARHTLRAEP